MKQILSIFLAVILLAAIPIPALAAEGPAIREAFDTTGDYMASLGDPTAGSTGGEWMALGFARSGRAVADSYYDSVVAYVNEKIDQNERLHPTKCSVNCRFVVALTAIGKDPTNVDGHDLLAGLNDMGYIRKVGISGLVWTLIAFDCGNYETPKGIDRNALLDGILSLETPNGGWANTGNTPDPDMTAMTIQALAPYRENNPAVQTTIDTALTVLSEMQDITGNFPGQYGASSESISQVIVALTTLGIDPNTDVRFVKDGVSAVDALLGYYVPGGGFRHIAEGKTDGVATEQAYYALTAYYRMLEGKTPLYDMTGTVQAPIPAHTNSVDLLWLWIILGCAGVLTLVCFLMRKKLGRRRFSNAIMVIVILLVAAVGIGYVLNTGALDSTPTLGSAYKITEIPGNRLVSSDDPENLCTITVRCNTILDNIRLLDRDKAPYVPADGVILPEITVEFTPGETVFDVLRRVCAAADIPLEYSWSPLYDSYYLEGIHHLYEFDCGAESGWIYRVGGAVPNYGCSAYQVKPGDRIEWLYTCIGLGADLGVSETEKKP